jgi:hypothetical protein
MYSIYASVRIHKCLSTLMEKHHVSGMRVSVFFLWCILDINWTYIHLNWWKLGIEESKVFSMIHAWITYDNLNAQAPVIFQRTSSSIILIPLSMMVVSSFMPTCDRVFVCIYISYILRRVINTLSQTPKARLWRKSVWLSFSRWAN